MIRRASRDLKLEIKENMLIIIMRMMIRDTYDTVDRLVWYVRINTIHININRASARSFVILRFDVGWTAVLG